ncbi:RagB/SusD family nutrient uptake outer membrane protein [Pontibacter silvestris]|uniref:RagB/SusD family nutrient uptake outer membrane protein n=1 Tax=Pontibacter silvestris TaxID=2305183 RepID=A0ABW4X3D3_9BACT|nr:RagB/SusD family nutrient uptake outer membrane protein [Pontibacter silvestris]MCC9134846.1 RagB/SusD family nutrient uptake outer membrane protein [Pontibacter silvestris]
MKKNILYMLLIACCLQGCKDFLEEDPESFIAPQNFYQSAADAEAALNAAYDLLNNIGPDSRNFIIMGDVSSDDVFPLSNNNDRVQIDQFVHTPVNGVLRETWRTMFQAITRTNAVIERVPAISMPDDQKERIVAEAHFLRALYYFYLVRWYGPLPLITKETNALADVEYPSRASVEEVYDLIIADLTAAEAGLPATLSNGHATKGSATGLLAKVYLTQKEWALAAQKAKEVMDMGIYDLWPTYAEAFKIENENGKESLFEIQYVSGGIGQGSNFMTYFARENSPVTGRGWGSFQPTLEVIDTLRTDPADTRFDVNLVQDPVDDNYYVDKYFDPDAKAAYEQDNNWKILRYADVLLMYAEALNEIAPDNPEAYTALNKVRRRAFEEDINASAPQPHDYANLSQSEFRRAVYGERRFELAFEGHRWFDLVRTGRLVSTMSAKGYSSVKPTHVYFPVPQDEVALNPNLGQNEGY